MKSVSNQYSPWPPCPTRMSPSYRYHSGMDATDNPYQAPVAELPKEVRPVAPAVVKLAVSLYVAAYLLALVSALIQGLDAPLLSIPAWILIGMFTAGISLALLRGKQWARMWIVLLTFMPVISLMAFTPWTAGLIDGGLAMARIVTRITVGCMMFLPSIRAWFAPVLWRRNP